MPKLGLARWEEIVENYYAKYVELKKWQMRNYKFVSEHGYYSSFTGRRYHFQKVKKFDGTYEYAWPSVCNYIVQGTATADIIPLVLVHTLPKIRKISPDIKLINQVHDSLVFDTPPKFISPICELCLSMFEQIPQLVKRHYSYDWITPMAGECKYGLNWSDMKTYEREPF